ncbi:hypothetical protein O6H91_Y139500 [Diphasiastrum complanatum]|nr:hypothetical protein O6H91_Y139500 [Diphasiastrum complanatum]
MELALQNMREEKIKPDVVTFNILIDSYGKSKDFAKMEQVFKSLCKSREKPSVTTFNSMISNYGRAALLQKMEYTVKKMVAAGCEPNLVTYEVLITSYGNCREFTMMTESYNQMVRAGICPLLSTLNAILEVYCRCGLLAEADNWLRNARPKMGVEPAASSYTILVKAFGKEGQFDKMHHLIERMEALGFKPNKKAFLEVLESYSKLETLTTTRNRQTTTGHG